MAGIDHDERARIAALDRIAVGFLGRDRGAVLDRQRAQEARAVDRNEVKARLTVEDGQLVILVYATDCRLSDKLLEGIREEIGIELCG